MNDQFNPSLRYEILISYLSVLIFFSEYAYDTYCI